MYKPTMLRSKDLINKDIMVDSVQNCILPGFDPYQPDPMFAFGGTRGKVENNEWKRIIVPLCAPPVDYTLPEVISRLVKSTWKWTTPSANRSGGSMKMVMGSRPNTGFEKINPVYTPVVRPTPTPQGITVTMNDATIANDWNLFNGIERTNAITLRGDSRSPYEIITNANGFHPPDTRTDRQYLEGGIYKGFNDYYKRRYDREIEKAKFLEAVDEATKKDPKYTQMFFDYMAWRGLMKSEASHLGRMASNECLKGYISTSRSIDSSIDFGCRANMSRDGYYIYVVQVNSGFVVPDNAQVDTQWGTGEAEIAQLGPIPAERVYGYRKFVRELGVGPVHMRMSFRSSDPQAFEKAFKILSGAKPDQVG
jgi:hypothetical protein